MSLHDHSPLPVPNVRKDNIHNTIIVIISVLSGPVLALLTSIIFSQVSSGHITEHTKTAIIIADIVYIVSLIAMITISTVNVGQLSARHLNTRLSLAFAAVACAPALILAVFTFVIIKLGLETWFNERISSVLEHAITISDVYVQEHLQSLAQTTEITILEIEETLEKTYLHSKQFQNTLSRIHQQRNLTSILIISDDKKLLTGVSSLSEEQTEIQINNDKLYPRQDSKPLITLNQDLRIIQAIAPISVSNNKDIAFIMTSKPINIEVIELLHTGKETFSLYQETEQNQNNILLGFSTFYVLFSLLNLVAAIWFGVWFSNRLSRPIGELIHSSDKIRKGDFSHKVHEGGSDEIALLARTFNKMTSEIQQQHRKIIQEHRESTKQRLLIEGVLAGVSSGVISLDHKGYVDLVNRSVCSLLHCASDQIIGRKLQDLYPEFTEHIAEITIDPDKMIEQKIFVSVRGAVREFLLRITAEQIANDVYGFILTIDDITELSEAQRMAAWGEVARRIAHEVKNPLTPIQLCAERLEMKYSHMIPSEHDRDKFNKYVKTIYTQVNGVKRIINEFTRFSRLPGVSLEDHELSSVLRDVALLQGTTFSDIDYVLTFPDLPVYAKFDPLILSQAIVNVMKNAAESIQQHLSHNKYTHIKGKIQVRLFPRDVTSDLITIEIEDNGTGLEDVGEQLMKPYFTRRKYGTGLGLDIVHKIIEQHGGTFTLSSTGDGAIATITILSGISLDELPP